jgi:large subunit ribosomal protein L10
MPNVVNEILFRELEQDFRQMGSCIVLQFDKLTVAQDENLRKELRSAGVDYKVVKNRLATRALQSVADVDLGEAFRGKCGVVFAREEKAIGAARLVREVMKVHKKDPPVRVVGGVIEGEAIVGAQADFIADMPDRHTVNTQLATAISGPARALATVVNAVAAGMARCIQAKLDKQAGPESPEPGSGEPSTAGEPSTVGEPSTAGEAG